MRVWYSRLGRLFIAQKPGERHWQFLRSGPDMSSDCVRCHIKLPALCKLLPKTHPILKTGNRSPLLHAKHTVLSPMCILPKTIDDFQPSEVLVSADKVGLTSLYAPILSAFQYHAIREPASKEIYRCMRQPRKSVGSAFPGNDAAGSPIVLCKRG